MKTYNIGIMGYGGFGRFLHNAWEKSPRLHISCVSDRDPRQVPSGDVRFYEDWRDLLRDPDVDIVSIATPPSFHADMACAAMEAGKHVLIEKPLALTTDEAKRIVETGDRTGVVSTLNFMQRFNPMIEALKTICDEGTLGRLRRVDVENHAQDETLPDSHWFWTPAVSGGILIEHAVHFIDMIHYMDPHEVVSVSGFVHKRDGLREDRVMANVLYDNGLMATHYHSFHLPGFFETTKINLVFDLAEIELEGWIPLKGRFRALVNGETKEKLTVLPGFNITELMKTDEITDDSRPEGWGGGQGENSRRLIFSGGIGYNVDELIKGVFGLKESKGEVYSRCLVGIMEDLLKKIENPRHNLRVTLEDGGKALSIAQQATEQGRKICPPKAE